MDMTNIIKTEFQDKEIYLIKTAHVSLQSVEDVKEAINELQPSSICIELDKDRYESLTKKDRWENTDINKVIKENKVGYLLVNMILSSFQRRMAKQLNSESGNEMKEGINLAKELNIPLVLADRSVNTTFSRIWNQLSFSQKVKLLTSIIYSLFSKEEISEEQLQALKESDALDSALQEISKEFPTVKKVLVDERDQYLAQKIKTAPGNKVVAIIGAAHAKGIVNNLNNDINLNELNKVEKKKGLSTYIKWIIPLLLIALVIYSFIKNAQVGFNQTRSWFIWNASLAALGTLLAFGHPLTILTSFILAPFTSLNPLLAVGWFAGYVQAKVSKPKVKDFQNLSIDTDNISGFWKNKVSRILLVVLFANLGSTIGTIVSGIDIVKAFLSLFD